MARGWLRIYLGAAPGVGKTFAMLDEAARRLGRGTDVVVGYVETHGRPKTAAQLVGLPIIPRRSVRYREQVLEEMDTPAIIARHPDVVLVDELAHTNAPGVEHEKRWQDVEQILDAGINVISTLNLQHLESVNDVVERITKVPQRETVPDAVVRGAEQIELVDMTPEALRRRLAHGNVYPAERVDAALANFFRPGNLAALRELALLWLADRVDDELQAYRERHDIDHTWETKERVVVTITGSPGTPRLIRRAARMAARSKAELVGVTVRRDDGLRSGADEPFDQHLALLAELGGRFIEVVSNDVAAALVAVALAENATQLVLGSSRRRRFSDLVNGSIVNRCVREAQGEIDVHVIGTERGDQPRHRRSSRRLPSGLSTRRKVAALVVGAIAFPVVTVLLLAGTTGASLALAMSSYLLVVLAVAAVGGLVPGLLAALVAFLVSNWEFAPPVHTFTIGNPRDVLALVSFLVAALTVSTFVDLAARRSAQAARSERDARALARLVSTVSLGDRALDEILAEIVRIFELDGAVLRRTEDEGLGVGDEIVAGEVQAPTSIVRLDEEHELEVSGGLRDPESQELLRGVAAQLVAVLDRRRLEHEAAGRKELQRADELRAALLAAVSHDLRTPLASIKTAATSLLSPGAAFTPDQSAMLLASIDSQADRLDVLIEELLDMSRVEEGSIELVTAEVDVVDLVELAAEEATEGVGVPPSSITLSGLGSLAAVTDPTLVVRLLANLLGNALRYGGAPVEVEVAQRGDEAVVRVVDHGPGVPASERDAIFKPFQRRGDVDMTRGVGLGLAIAKGFADALGGGLEVEETPGGGCTMVLTVPTLVGPPRVSVEG